jgi:hypothetical protein
MSITPQDPPPAPAGDPAERALFRALVDDAAVFPPGLAPLPRAVAEHLARRSEPWADLVGPLLVPAAAATELLDVPRDEPLDVVLVARPGTALTVVEEAVDRLAGDATLSVVAVEIGWSDRWHEAMGWDLPVSVEVPRGPDQLVALEDIREHTAGKSPLQAKLRTGSTDTAPVPDAAELATFLRTCVDMDLGFKLTGGLHRAVAHTTADGEDQHGFLNVLCATRWALAHAAEVPELVALLSERDPAPLVDILTGMSHADASVVRAFFTAYGCCGVADPVHDLSTLGLITETA